MEGTIITHVPYCGKPPLPADIWLRWNLDPVLLSGLAAVAIAYAINVRKLPHVSLRARASFYAGWIVVTAGLISPICPLSVALFSARVGQHMILLLFGAPLMALGHPGEVFGQTLRVISRPRPSPLIATAVFASILWLWHAPLPYAWTFESTFVYWAMHFTLFGSALWLWCELLNRQPEGLIRRSCASAIASIQMGFLGALITFAPRAVYVPHFFTTIPWGMSSLQDQQLGGVIMWVPGCVIFLAIASYEFWRAIEETPFETLEFLRDGEIALPR
ncbi:MAG: cytochrome c oxidase assembly protein [Candidatus Binataceae bacterium]|nr:cytochrome c oxidase assembly protein [Candidatus Binataceae bacterium]